MEDQEDEALLAKLRVAKGTGGASRLQRLLADAGLDATTESVVRAIGEQAPSVKGVQFPNFLQHRPNPLAMAGPSHLASTTTGLWHRSVSKDIVKLAEFSGGKGYGSPDEADSWLRSLARAISINCWNQEEVFEHVQSKLVGAAAVWYRNREHLFHAHPLVVDAGWRTFWTQFGKKFVAHDEQALWLQFKQRVSSRMRA